MSRVPIPPWDGSPGSRSARLGRALQAAEDQLQRQAVLSALIRAVHSAPVALCRLGPGHGSQWSLKQPFSCDTTRHDGFVVYSGKKHKYPYFRLVFFCSIYILYGYPDEWPSDGLNAKNYGHENNDD